MTSRKDWLASWANKVSERSSRPIIELHIGDSITEGMGSSNLQYAWTAMQQKEYEATWPTTGPMTYGFEYVCAWYNMGGTSPGSLTAGPTYTNATGTNVTASLPKVKDTYGLILKTAQATTGHAMSLTRVATSMTVRIFHRSANTAYKIYIDGVERASVSNRTGFVETNIAGLGGVSRTLRVVFTNAGTSRALIDGVAVYRGTETKGFQVWAAGYSGSFTAKFVTNQSWEE